MTYVTEAALLWLACTVMVEVGPVSYFAKPASLRLAGTDMSEVETHNIFHRARITVVGWRGYGRDRGPEHISRSLHYCGWLVPAMVGPIMYSTESLWLAGTVTVEVAAITYFAKPALLWLAGMIMGDVGAHNIFH